MDIRSYSVKAQRLMTVAGMTALTFCSPPARSATFVRGDANDSGVVDLSDAVFDLSFLFTGGAQPPCLDAADANDDGVVDISDAVAVLTFLFVGGIPLDPPYPGCGADPTVDPLGCVAFAHCTSCYGQSDLDKALADNVDPVECIPAGQVEPVTIQGFTVTACPLDLAAPCPDAASPTKGCPVQLTSVEGRLDVPAREIRILFAGQLNAFPISIKESTFGLTADCRFKIDFSGELLVFFTTSPGPGGTLTVVKILDPTLESAGIEVSTASTNLICRAVVGLKDQFVDELVAQIQPLTEGILEVLRAELVGKNVCAPLP